MTGSWRPLETGPAPLHRPPAVPPVPAVSPVAKLACRLVSSFPPAVSFCVCVPGGRVKGRGRVGEHVLAGTGVWTRAGNTASARTLMIALRVHECEAY